MSLQQLREKIESKQAQIAVIGLGYVGLPVAASFAEAGYEVVGLDILQDRIDKINRGENPIEGNEPGMQELLAKVVAGGKFHATSDYTEAQDCDVILIDVETPVDADHKPRYQALRSALASLALNMKDGALVIVESTIAPGTMHGVVLAQLEGEGGKTLNQDFYLGNCPERVMPGKLLHNLRKLDRVVGGMTPETAETMVALYGHVVEGDLDATDCVTAELVKTAENAYRDVQIAFANELALISEAAGGDVWKVRELVNKSPGRHMLLPGAGVGGHCIPKDPWLLAYGVEGKEVDLSLIPAARAINDSMPLHILNLLERALQAQGRELDGARVLVMGFAYLEDSDDTRNSPSAVLVEALNAAGGAPVVHDPFVAEYEGDLLQMATGCDAAVLMVAHSEYKQLDLAKLAQALSTAILIDGRGVYSRAAAQAAGLKYTGIGQAG